MLEQIGTLFSVIFMLVLFVGILFLAYYLTTFVGKRYSGKGGGSKYIKVLDRAYLGQDKSVVLLQTGEKTILLGVTQHHVELLCDVDPTALPEQPEESPADTGFSDVLQTVLKNNWGLGAPNKKKGKSHDGKI